LGVSGSANITGALTVMSGANVSNGLNVISGNVGIGTVSPGSTLTVAGNANISSSAGSGGADVRVTTFSFPAVTGRGISIGLDGGNNAAISSIVDGSNSASMTLRSKNVGTVVDALFIDINGFVGISNTKPNVTFYVSGNANVSGRLSYGTLAANSPHFLETMGSPEPLCVKAAIGKYVGCMVDDNFEFKCSIDDRCNRKYLDARLSQEIDSLNKELKQEAIDESLVDKNTQAKNNQNPITGNVANELGLETNLSNILSNESEINETSKSAINSFDKDSVKKRIERLSKIKKEVKEKTRTVKEAINELKLEELKEVDINEIESEEDAQYTQLTKGKEKTSPTAQLDYMTKVNGSVIIRIG